MSSPPPDELPVLGGVWVGAEPSTTAAGPPRPRPPRRGPVLVGTAALVLAGGIAGYLNGPQPFAPILGVLIGLAFSGLAYLLLTRPPRQPAQLPPAVDAARLPEAAPPAPMPVIYSPIPLAQPPAKPREIDELTESLMQMCKGDLKLFERLVNAERQRHPRKPRRELIRLAIARFWGGHR